MKLHGKKLLMLVTDGVDYQEVRQLREGFEKEYAEVFLTSPHEFLSIETVEGNHRGENLVIDFPLDALGDMRFDGLVIPDGMLSTDLLEREPAVRELVRSYHESLLPLFVSGEAVRILESAGILSGHILVRDIVPLPLFIDQAVNLLLDEGKRYRFSAAP